MGIDVIWTISMVVVVTINSHQDILSNIEQGEFDLNQFDFSKIINFYSPW